jgi:hypothetical protein
VACIEVSQIANVSCAVSPTLEIDGSPQAAFCQWLLLECTDNPQLLSTFLFMEDRIVNVHMLADENPHTTFVTRYQHHFFN